MATHDQSIEVYGSLRAVYRQWTQFETYRFFMDGVRSVTRSGDGMTHWIVERDGQECEFDAAISEDETNHRVTWAATSSPTFAGLATVYPIDARTTRVRLQTDIEGEAADPGGATRPGEGGQAERDLDRFKRYVEASGDETGAWQGFVGDQPT
ncbi:MAG: cyclase [Actinomycetota bacterium]|nr:cyclase [Actinomycetota bacterium]